MPQAFRGRIVLRVVNASMVARCRVVRASAPTRGLGPPAPSVICIVRTRVHLTRKSAPVLAKSRSCLRCVIRVRIQGAKTEGSGNKTCVHANAHLKMPLAESSAACARIRSVSMESLIQKSASAGVNMTGGEGHAVTDVSAYVLMVELSTPKHVNASRHRQSATTLVKLDASMGHSTKTHASARVKQAGRECSVTSVRRHLRLQLNASIKGNTMEERVSVNALHHGWV